MRALTLEHRSTQVKKMSDNENDEARSLVCIMHVCHGTGKLTPFTDKSWKKFVDCANKWKILDGKEAEIARSATISEVIPDFASYHRNCYKRFCDVSKIKRAEERRTKTDAACEYKNIVNYNFVDC